MEKEENNQLLERFHFHKKVGDFGFMHNPKSGEKWPVFMYDNKSMN